MSAIESYTLGYGIDAVSFVGRRTVQSHAAFLIPRLKPGLRVLDCGCGPGTISMGLARLVAPGEVVGIDREPSQLELARNNAHAHGVTNVRFETASVYELPYPDSSFDLVFSHALFEHLKEPSRALREFWRVLKPGGMVALRSPDWGGFLISPETPALNDAVEYFKFLQSQNGGNVYVGRTLKALLNTAGFTEISATATYECCEPLSYITDFLATRIEESVSRDEAIERGWSTEARIAEMGAALRGLSQEPGALFALAWCEVIGTK